MLTKERSRKLGSCLGKKPANPPSETRIPIWEQDVSVGVPIEFLSQARVHASSCEIYSARSRLFVKHHVYQDSSGLLWNTQAMNVR